MLRSVFLFFLYLVFFVKTVSATIFTVTSNADSGPGTLREALALAAENGTFETDHIYFSLPVPDAGRTIFVLAQLPALTSNLIIDASAQPGQKFGATDARVKLVSVIKTKYEALFLVNNQENIGIYSLFFETSPGAVSGIFYLACTSSKNIIIGGPGKGNLFKDLGISVKKQSGAQDVSTSVPDNIKISSNIFGLAEDGETYTASGNVNLSFTAVRNLTIGGDAAAEGNVINGSVSYIDYLNTASAMGTLVISGNKFGVDALGSKATVNAPSSNSISITGQLVDDFQFRNNQLCGTASASFINMNCFSTIQGNKFGTDASGNNVIGSSTFSISLNNCKGGLIGGQAPGLRNIFAGAFTGIVQSQGGGIIVNSGSPKFELVNNVFKCNNSSYPYSFTEGSNRIDIPVFKIASRSASQIKGTASPSARIDLYYSLTCSHCEPEQLFATVLADNAGNWVYSGAIEPNNIIGASTLSGQTSEFSSMRYTYQPFDVKIKMACGGAQGSITGIRFVNARNYGWYRESGELVSKTIDLANALPGKYKFMIDDGFCALTSESFTIENVVPVNIIETGAVVQNDECGHDKGAVKGLIVKNGKGDYHYTWYNSKGTSVATSLNLVSVKAGTYYLEVKDDTDCSAVSTPFIIENIESGLMPPDAVNVSLCSPGTAIIAVNSPQAGMYKIYDTDVSALPLKESTNGIFAMEVATSRDYFISFADGTCESKRTKVSVGLVSGELVFINSFTPNADGVNDTWTIRNIEKYPKSQVRIYNRDGSPVFVSEGYTEPFDGKLKGSELPVGVYYYFVELKSGCSPIRGSLVLLR